MATSSALIKTILHKSLAEGVYRDVVTKSSNYYYFLGKTLEWSNETQPPYPVDSYAYERATRNDIITMKQVGPSDVAFVIPRINWTSGTVYDMYDDEYCNEIIGINVINGGSGYTSLPTITITGGGGTGAKFYPIVYDGSIIGIEDVGVADTSRGTGYKSQPTVTVTGGSGAGAILEAVLNVAPSGASKLEDAIFYVMTEDYNVYKCLDNNNGAKSVDKPISTSTSPITMNDGYVWKYMYNVPINLRSKFLSDENIPVTSALTNQFYSNGSLDSVVINNKGSGYTTATITVSGDGYREEDPLFISNISVIDGGTGYTSPTLTISDPVANASVFLAGSTSFLGQKVYNSTYDFYEVVTPGTFTTSEPSHKSGIVQNGTATLKYLGTRAKGIVNVSGGAVSSVTLVGQVREVQVVNSGSGYLSTPSVTISGGGGSGATAVAKMNGDSVMYVTVTNGGDNYTTDPTVTFGKAWTASTAVTVNQQLSYSGRLYTVTAAGTTGATGPSHTTTTVNAGSFVVGTRYTILTVGTTDYTLIGATSNTIGTSFIATGVGSGTGTATTYASATNGTATLKYAGVPATGKVIRRFGAGYTTTPTATINQANHTGVKAEIAFQIAKSEAKLLPIIENGQITGVIVINAGIGYSAVNIQVDGDGQDAALSADLSVGSIQSLQANNEILTVDGTINAIAIISGGYGYGVADIEIDGDGTGATATATIDTASGKITKINITNPGQNYTYATVSVTGNGQAAKLRAIISPYGGHGKNAPDELFARTLMFYSNVSTDLNQGVAVNNDYRQVGIIKNPRGFETGQRFQGSIGSACYIVAANINTSYFTRDKDVVITRYFDGQQVDKRYRIVAASTSSALVQSLDNDVPAVNDTFQSTEGYTFTAITVSAPTIDKYSGQLMFIDNKAGFTPSTEETVTLRTIIKF